MRHGVAVALVLLSALRLGADPLPDLFEQALAVNTTYRVMEIDSELAQMRYQKGQIEAQNERDELAVESSFLQARAGARSSMRSFYNAVIDAVFKAATAELSVRAAELSLSIAQNAYVLAQTRYEGGLISDEDLKQAELQSDQAEQSLRQAQYDLEAAQRNLERETGLSWMWSLIPAEPGSVIAPDAQTYVALDLGLQSSQLSVRQAELALANVPENASRYDRLTAESELERARINLQETRASVEEAFFSAARGLARDEEAARIAFEQLEIERSLLLDSQARYDRGLITRDARDQQQIKVYNARSSYLRALQSYLSAIVSYAVAVDMDLSEVL
jgi:outer membrane protein TolC